MTIYYVLSRTLWKGDSYWPCAGPFQEKDQAEAAASKFADDGWTDPIWSDAHNAWIGSTQDLKRVIKTIVVTKTEMQKVYGWTSDMADEQIAYGEMMKRDLEELVKGSTTTKKKRGISLLKTGENTMTFNSIEQVREYLFALETGRYDVEEDDMSIIEHFSTESGASSYSVTVGGIIQTDNGLEIFWMGQE